MMNERTIHVKVNNINQKPVCTHPSTNVSLLAFSLFQSDVTTSQPQLTKLINIRAIVAHDTPSMPGMRTPVEPRTQVNFSIHGTICGLSMVTYNNEQWLEEILLGAYQFWHPVTWRNELFIRKRIKKILRRNRTLCRTCLRGEKIVTSGPFLGGG